MAICVAYIYNAIIVSPLRLTQTNKDKSTYCTQIYGPTAGLLFEITYIQMIQVTQKNKHTHEHTPTPCCIVGTWYQY